MPLRKRGEQNAERELTLIGHLEELRVRLFICVGAFMAFILVCWFFSDDVLEILIKPVESLDPRPAAKTISTTLSLMLMPEGDLRVRDSEDLKRTKQLDSLVIVLPPSQDQPTTQTLTLIGRPRQSKIIYASPLDPITMRFKVDIVMSILFSLFVWIWQIWLFVAPGLTEKEKAVIRPLLVGAIFLFPIGAFFAYGMLFMIIQLMQTYIVPGIDTLYNVANYLKLTTTLMIVFGIIFELPVVVAVLARIGVVTPAFLRFYRKHIYVGLAVASMILTPTTDPFTMLIALAPLIILFEISVWIATPIALMRAKAEAADSGGSEPA